MINALSIGLTVASITTFMLLSTTNINAKEQISVNEYESSRELKFNSEKLMAVAAKYDNVRALTGAELTSHNIKIDDILMNEKLSNNEKLIGLKQLGVYNVEDGVLAESASSSSGDYSASKPTISYDSKTKQYIITGKGRWKRHTYEVPTFSWWYPSVGDTKNIGGNEGIGISITNTSGSTKGLAINSGYGYFYNGNAKKKSTTLVTNNDNYGGGYKVQDFIKFTKVDNYVFWVNTEYYYNAYNAKCVLKYNSKFAKYNGNAKLFYSHTWDKTKVTGIGLSKSGVNISWSDNSDKWNAYSYARTFKKGRASN